MQIIIPPWFLVTLTFAKSAFSIQLRARGKSSTSSYLDFSIFDIISSKCYNVEKLGLLDRLFVIAGFIISGNNGKIAYLALSLSYMLFRAISLYIASYQTTFQIWRVCSVEAC